MSESIAALLDRGHGADLAAVLAEADLAGVAPAAVDLAMGHLCARGERAAALALYQRAVAAGLAMGLPQPLIEALKAAGDTDAALALVTGWRPQGQPQAFHILTRAQELDRLGRSDLARAEIDAAAPQFSRNPALASRQAYLALMAGDRSAALAALSRAVSLPDCQPWPRQALRALTEATLELDGLTLHTPAEAISPRMIAAFVLGQYETQECEALRADLRAEDRLLEFGSGIGLIALTAWQTCPGLPILTVEANPALAPVIAANFASNGCGATALSGIVALSDAEAEFHPAADFWASSTLAVAPDTIRCPTIDANRLIRDFAPTVLVMDIEGGEAALFPGLDLSGLRRLVIEFHPALYGDAEFTRILRHILDAGFLLERTIGNRQVCLFARAPSSSLA